MKLNIKMKYRHKVAAVIFFIVLPFLVLSLLLVKNAWDDRVEGILAENRAELQSSADAIDEALRLDLQKLTYVTNNRMITTFLESGDFSDMVESMTIYDNIEEVVDALVLGSTDIDFKIYPVSVNAYNGKYVERLERLAARLGQDELDRLLDHEALADGVWMYQPGERAQEGLGYLACYKKMQMLSGALAVTELRVRVKKALDGLSDRFPEGTVLVYRPDDGHRIALMMAVSPDGPQWRAMDADEIESGRYHRITAKLGFGPGDLTEFLPRSHIQQSLRSYLILTLVSVAAALLLLFFIVELAAQLLTKRITKLVDMANVTVDNTHMPLSAGKYWIEDDLGAIEAKISELLDNIHANYLRSMEYENEKKLLELEILQSKINPHFLYNTLSTMRWNCNNERMAQTIDSMVQYYRLSLNKGQSIVTISHELKLVEEYLKILKYTYSSDFEYFIDVDDDVKNAWIVKHLLQPIVENAVLHGINGLENGGGVIRLAGSQKGGVITLTIGDNGVGMPEETLMGLRSGEYKSKVGGYGLQSIRKRIALFYGSIYSLDIESSPGFGTTVTITFPAVHPDNCEI